MSNSIWKMPDQKPDIFQAHRVLVIYEAHDEPELMLSTQYEAYTADRYINRWCYWDEFIAQADNAERLEKENEAMREEFEVWHENYKCVVEDKERLQKAVDCALEELQRVAEDEDIDWLRAESARTTIDEIKQLIKENQ